MDNELKYNENDLVNLKTVLEKFSADVIDQYKQQINQHRASGNLEKSLSSSIDISLNETPTIKITINIADYYRYLENGRGPTGGSGNSSGKTLKESILEWIRVKGIIPRADANGKLPSEASLAYLIARKIHNEGYSGDDSISLQNVINNVWETYKQPAEEALIKDFNSNISQQILNRIQNIKV